MCSLEREELREQADPAGSLYQTPTEIRVKEEPTKLHSKSDYAETQEGLSNRY